MGIFSRQSIRKEKTRNAIWWRLSIRKERIESLDATAKRIGITRAELADLLIVGGLLDLDQAKGKERPYLAELRKARVDFGLALEMENQAR